MRERRVILCVDAAVATGDDAHLHELARGTEMYVCSNARPSFTITPFGRRE
jgi:hypothetical protein